MPGQYYNSGQRGNIITYTVLWHPAAHLYNIIITRVQRIQTTVRDNRRTDTETK